MVSEIAPVILLAGGFGTRLGTLTSNCPKPMIPVLGRPFLSWLLEHLVAEGFQDFIVSTGYLAEVIENHSWKAEFPECRFRFERETEPLGTGGAIQRIYERHPELDWSWVVNADTLLPDPILPHLKGASSFDVLYITQKPGLIYDAKPNLAVRDDRVTGEVSDGDVFDAGSVLLNRKAVAAGRSAAPFSLARLLTPTMQSGRATFSVSDKPCFDIGTPLRLKRFEDYLRERFGPGKVSS